MKKGIIAVVAVVIIVLVAAYMLFLRKPAGPEATILAAGDAMNDRDADKLYSLFSSEIRETATKEELVAPYNSLML